MEDNQIETDKNSAEIEKLRSELIAQDHRLFTTLRRYFVERKTWPKDDPRHAAVKMALIYAFFSPAAIAVGGGGIALASLGVLLWQNSILIDQNALAAKQNHLIASQNAFLQEQIKSNNRQWLEERKASLLSIIYDKKECHHDDKKECPASNVIARVNAIVGLHSIKSEECYESNCVFSMQNVDLNEAEFIDHDLKNTAFYKSELNDARFHRVEAPAIKITRSDASDIRFYFSNISNCKIELTAFGKDRVSYAEFHMSNLSNCRITIPSRSYKACFTGSNLTGAVISRGLPRFSWPGVKEKIEQDYDFSFTNITNADLSGLEFLEPDQFIGACSNGGTKLSFSSLLPKCKDKIQVPAFVQNSGCGLTPFDFWQKK